MPRAFEITFCEEEQRHLGLQVKLIWGLSMFELPSGHQTWLAGEALNRYL
jgi:hypothetical protein